MSQLFKKLLWAGFSTICFGLGLILSTNKVFAQELIANNPKEKKILSLVAALPEVKKRAQEIINRSNGKTQITLMISANPDVYIPYYQVNVNDNAPTYNNYYQFAVDPKTYQIFYYDAVKNRQYSLPEWRKIKLKGSK
ncbi:MAG: hypothetical protein EOP42_23090 [Sphingobacteriaceae bacterium]|nr:MAG: hypothetical protein EOP42_23090 [Sphingobacteriaceae bacterium]